MHSRFSSSFYKVNKFLKGKVDARLDNMVSISTENEKHMVLDNIFIILINPCKMIVKLSSRAAITKNLIAIVILVN